MLDRSLGFYRPGVGSGRARRGGGRIAKLTLKIKNTITYNSPYLLYINPKYSYLHLSTYISDKIT